jgi:hypothetical protein
MIECTHIGMTMRLARSPRTYQGKISSRRLWTWTRAADHGRSQPSRPMITAGLVMPSGHRCLPAQARPAAAVNTASAGALSGDPVSLYWQVSGYR